MGPRLPFFSYQHKKETSFFLDKKTLLIILKDMKLYTKSQLLLASIFSAAVVGLLVALGFMLLKPIQGSSSLGAFNSSGAAAIPVVTADDLNAEEKQNIQIYQNLNEGVVNISTEVMTYNWFLEPVPQSGGTGSGSIIDKKGYVLTNRHVINNAVKVYITLYDGSQYEGSIVGQDAENDLAVVKFDPKGRDLTLVPMGTSNKLKVGQKVLAIGNPFALDRTMTTGIVSALGRPLRSESGLILHQLIQTDASINPGNSGGPLLNSRGELIGITTMIYSPSGGSVGIGFAVPVDTSKRVVPELIQYGKVIRGWIDIDPVQIFPQLVKYAHLSVSKGLLVSKVSGTAQKAGLKGGTADSAVRYGNSILYLGGDIITAINGQDISSLADLYGALEASKPGQSVKVNIVRGTDKIELNIPLVNRPDKFQWGDES
jgi:S1-C subfamily serine protease